MAIAGLLAALALVYTNATGVADVAADARLQQQAESALGAASAARNALGQAILITGSTDDPSLAAAAISEAALVLEAMEERVLLVGGGLADSAELDADLTAVLSESASVLNALAAGDAQRAGEIATGSSAAAFTILVDDIVVLRDELATAIAAASAESGTVATASRFMVAFFVPSMAVAVAFLVARRRRKRELLAIELEQERALNRSKDQLIANISHELRTPLTGIYTSALAIEEVGVSDAELNQELTGIIIDQSADLTRMVEDLLISAQADAGRLRFDLRPTEIGQLTAGLEREFGRLEAQIDFDLEPGFVLADPGRLRQLLRNLVSNGTKYGDGDVTIKGRLNDSTYVLEVVDNGPGVPQDVENRMFERFVHRGDQPLLVGSIGLGLAISKVLAEGMSGTIAYRRSNDETTFEVILERAIGPDAEMPPDPAPYEALVVVADEDREPEQAIDPDPKMARYLATYEPPTVDDAYAQMPPDPVPFEAPLVVADEPQPAADPDAAIHPDPYPFAPPAFNFDDASEPSPQLDLTNIKLPNAIRDCLETNGVTTVEDLLTRSPGDLLALDGIGPTRLAAIGKAIAAHAPTSTENVTDLHSPMRHDTFEPPALAFDDASEPSPRLDLTNIKLPNAIRHCLEANGISTVEGLLARSTGDLLALDGIGPNRLAAIGRAVAARHPDSTGA